MPARRAVRRHDVLGLLHRRAAGPRLRRRRSARTPRRTPRSSTRCSTAGVYLPPSAYEAWFVSAAHDDARRADRRSTRCRPPPAAAAGRGRRRTDPMSRHDHRPPAAARRGAQPRGRPLRPPRRLPPLRARPADGRSGSPRRIGDRDIIHLRRLAAGARPGDRRARWPRPAGSTPSIDPRVIESANVFEGKRFGVGDDALRKPSHLDAPVEPVQAVVGRALQGGRRPDAGRGARRPRRRARPRGGVVSHQLPIWITRLHAGEAVASCTTRASASARCAPSRRCSFDGDQLTHGQLLRAGRRPDPGRATAAAPFSAGGAPRRGRP